ncbi:nucleotide-binding universal stress UspA family protein [Epilithonimonas hungarica]|uniref:universal stress protein n=1 Tax=Epilithonimonas hungarica TaxID=454006 RepID=UPI002783977A|nr:universal stress protein [Epilithonimonas hungarica]MDP9955491.1 nucleotide-binding universal stress UspA family protein [Epilithonimonas hungarica]
MRTILVATDFSKASKNAANYALHLASPLKANIELCHAFSLPSESPMLGQISWVLYEYPELVEENNKELKKQVKDLEQKENKLLGDGAFPFHPSVDYLSEVGDTIKVINDMASHKNTILIVMGMTGAGTIKRFFLGSNSIQMIDKTKYPLLLIPENHKYKPITKIAFSTDLNKKDVKTAQSLINFAKCFNAELLITYILQSTNDVTEDRNYEHTKEKFLKNLDGKYYYNCIYSENVDYGLDILKNKDIDILVMGHQQRGFFESLIKSSHAVKQAEHMQIPLLIIPESADTVFRF